MIFIETQLKGAFIIESEKLEDERGFFARTWCQCEFEARGLNPKLVQCSVSFNKLKGTLRGMHYQTAPHEEAKLVRCTRGAIYDVIIDLRPESYTYKKWIAIELTADDQQMLYIPQASLTGFKHLKITQSSSTRCPSFIIQNLRGGCVGMTLRLGSNGQLALRLYRPRITLSRALKLQNLGNNFAL